MATLLNKKRPSKRDLILILVIAVCFMVIGGAIRGLFTKPVIEVKPFDTSKQDKTIDSLSSIINQNNLDITRLKTEVDSIQKLKTENHNNLHHEIGKIKRFTPTLRHRWNDSILRAEGLR